jgi:hypothetical protein
LSEKGLFDPALLKNASQRTFERVWGYFAQTFLLIPPSSVDVSATTNTVTAGSINTIHRQLHARPTSVRIAQGSICALVIITLGLYLLQPKTNLPREPNSLAAIASFLAINSGSDGEDSTMMAMAMDGCGGMNEKDMERRLKGWRFGTVGTGKTGDFAFVTERISGSEPYDVNDSFLSWYLVYVLEIKN